MKKVEELTSEQIDKIYEDFYEYVNSLAFGYGRADGAELVMLKRFYTPIDALNVMDMPKDEFFTASQFAEIEGIGEIEAKTILNDLAKRANIYHEKDENGEDIYHVLPYAHGIYEFHTRWFEPDWLFKGLFPVLVANGDKPFSAGIPFYHALPCGPEVVEGGEIPEQDDIWKILASKRRFAVCPCDCAATSRDMINPEACSHPTNVCIQTDAMADYYIDDIKTGKEITYEQAKKILEHGIKSGLIVQTTFSKKNEIICSCALCHCGILQGAKSFPGDACANQSRYWLKYDPDICVKCGVCAKSCPMAAVSMGDDGRPVVDASCVGCGQCVLACPQDARILVRKDDVDIHEYAQDMWESYTWMEQHRRNKGTL